MRLKGLVFHKQAVYVWSCVRAALLQISFIGQICVRATDLLSAVHGVEFFPWVGIL